MKKVYQFIVQHPDTVVTVVSDDPASAMDKVYDEVGDNRCILSIASVTKLDEFKRLIK